MGLQKEPVRKTFLGVHWTQWPWPRLVFAAMARRFLKRPDNPTSSKRMGTYMKLTALYIGISATAFAVALKTYLDGPATNKTGKEYATLVSKRTFTDTNIFSAKTKVNHVNITGFNSYTVEDITDDVKAAIEADKPPAIKETEEEYMERLKKENFAKWAIIESKRRRKEAAEKKEQEKEKE